MSTTLTTTDVQLILPSALEIRREADRGKADHGWLQSAHSFSFADYQNRQRMNFEALRVINDDEIAGGAGFPMHPHADFEIFSYVLDGAISHEDSMGNGSTVTAGGIQYMSAGTGVTHSEFNPSETEKLRILQIWLTPETRGVVPRYEVRELSTADKDGQLALFVSEDGRNGSISSYAPAEVYAGTFSGHQSAAFTVREGRSAYVHVAKGAVSINGVELIDGDAISTRKTGDLLIDQGTGAEILVFDLKQL